MTEAALTAIISGAAAATSGAAQGIGTSVKNKKGYKYTKKLMAKQQEYNLQNFQLQNQRQDWLLKNEQLLNKQALKNAGYSAADPNGTGFSPMQAPMPVSPSGQQFVNSPVDVSELSKLALLGSQIRNMDAQTKKVESETEGQDIQNWLNSKYGEQQIQSALANLDEDTKKKISETLYNDQQRLNSIQLTESQVRNIEERLDMDWQKLPLNLQVLAADAYEARESGNLKHAQISEVWQSIKESQKRIQKLQSDIGLNDAQIGVLLCQAENIAQSTKNLGQDFKIKGNEIVETANRAELQQFQTDVQKSMGLTFYQAKNVVETILPIGMFGAAANMALGRAPAAAASAPAVAPASSAGGLHNIPILKTW